MWFSRSFVSESDSRETLTGGADTPLARKITQELG